MELPCGADATVPTLCAIEPTEAGVDAFLGRGRWTHEPDVRDILPTATSLLPFSSRGALPASQAEGQACMENSAMPIKLHRGLNCHFFDPDSLSDAGAQCPGACWLGSTIET